MELPQSQSAELQIPPLVHNNEWERKQRNREYRIAARREKRNRKADEKKQRKLNATLLRRMTRNPDKFNKNVDRNRLRDIELERRKIYQQAVGQAQRLAAIHDPSGAMFNVSPVFITDDGSVITEESLRRRREKAAEKKALDEGKESESSRRNEDMQTSHRGAVSGAVRSNYTTIALGNHLNPERAEQIEPKSLLVYRSKNQMKRLAKLEPRLPPPKPTRPEHIPSIDGEEDWLSLWDLNDEDVERRVNREKKRKAAARKALRNRQQSGKVERRMARDEKRRVYRDIKLEWKSIKEDTTRERTRLKALEDEESKKIAVQISEIERARALTCCSEIGFTLGNNEGVNDINRKTKGVKGIDVDFDAIGKGDQRSDIKQTANRMRVDLSIVPQDENIKYIPAVRRGRSDQGEGFIKLEYGDGQDFETPNYNHKVRRKLRRAIEHAEVEKELLVRQRALDHYEAKGLDAPAILRTKTKPVNVNGQRILENGTLETSKQQRTRARMELTEFNARMRVLRRQAKEAAINAGLRKYAQVTGRIPQDEAMHESGPDQAISNDSTSEGYAH